MHTGSDRMRFIHYLFILSFSGISLAYSGEFVPKSYYFIDKEGHKSDVIYFRSKRDIENFPLFRPRRSSSSSSSGASSSSYAGSIGPSDLSEIEDFVKKGLSSISPQNFGMHNFLQSRSFAAGPQMPSGAGYNGPILFSRSGEGVGRSVKTFGQAAGPNGAFSASSSSVDSDGKVKYSVQSGKY